MSKPKKQTKDVTKKDVKNEPKRDEIVEEGAGIAFKETVDMETYAYEGRRATVDEPIPLGVVPDINVLPKRMRAWVIRRERHGEPMDSFKEETMPVPEIGPNDVLVLVMAAGVNYNGVWAGLGQPVSVLDIHKRNFHIAGSDAAGIVWRVGSNVNSWKPGDEVILHCNVESETHSTRTETPYDFISYDPMASRGQKIWGYETPWGSFAQFTVVQAQQVLPKPEHLTWEEAASYGLCYFTAYRMLITQAQLQPSEIVLVWGGAGGLGVFALQICKMVGADAIAVVSSDDKAELCMELGAKGVINRRDFPHLMFKHGETEEEKARRFEDMKRFGQTIWKILGERRNPNVVFEHVGEATFPTSVFTCSRFGRIVICAGTSGYDCVFDVRHLWMHQKRIIGSHFANALECIRANELVRKGIIKPVLSQVYPYNEIPKAHQLMYENRHSGKMAVLVQVDREGLRNTEEARRARASRA
ncbi:MAG TPA: crotonyl-CoA carboxylase/reductase [Thermodesulfobacteriota bacterium]|nr:crotonyl-CoA carboxylase/reductase [Thermodesulfobacteriota bacterium]